MRYRLEPFSAESTEAYIKHRLRLAGLPAHALHPRGGRGAAPARGGSPRVINTLCDNALFEAFLVKQHEVDAPRIEAIAANLSFGVSESDADGEPPPDARVVDLSEVDRYLAGLKS